MLEVLQCRTFTQKFWVRDDRESDTCSLKVGTSHTGDHIAAADRDCALIDDDGIVVEMLGDTACCTLHIAHISATLMILCWRIDCNKNKFAVFQPFLVTGGKV